MWKTRKEQNFQRISKTHVWLLRKDRLVQEKTQKHLSLKHLLTLRWYSLQFLFPGFEENKNLYITQKKKNNNNNNNNDWDISMRRAYTKIELREEKSKIPINSFPVLFVFGL